MTNTIPNVPRVLLEVIEQTWRIHYKGGPVTTDIAADAIEKGLGQLRALLSAPSPAGVDGPVRNFKTREGYDVWDKLCAIPKFGFLIGPSGGVVKVADIGNWIDRDEAQSVVDEAQCEVNLLRHEASDAQAIIDGLRGESEVMTQHANNYSRMFEECAEDRDQHAQRIGELEGLLLRVQVSLSLDDTEWGYSGAEKYKLLSDIRAALSSGKKGE